MGSTVSFDNLEDPSITAAELRELCLFDGRHSSSALTKLACHPSFDHSVVGVWNRRRSCLSMSTRSNEEFEARLPLLARTANMLTAFWWFADDREGQALISADLDAFAALTCRIALDGPAMLDVVRGMLDMSRSAAGQVPPNNDRIPFLVSAALAV